MQQDQEFQFEGYVSKDVKKIFENVQKIKKNEHFFIVVQRQKVDLMSLGRTDVHRFSINLNVLLQTPLSIQKIDLETFKQAVSLFKNNMHYKIRMSNSRLHVESNFETHSGSAKYRFEQHSLVPLLQITENDLENVKLMLNLSLNDLLVQLEFHNVRQQQSQPQQFQLLGQQIKALKIPRIRFELIPEQSSLRLQTVYYGDGDMTLRFVFNNFKILHKKQITELERFTFNSEEFINSVLMLDRESEMSFVLTSNGSLVLSELESEITTKSILSRIIVHEEY